MSQNSDDWVSAISHITVAWIGWFFSNINYFVGVAALILTGLQIYVLWRDKLRKKEK